MKCLKQVLRWASSLRLTILWKCEWYIWAYTRKRRLKIVFTTSRKLGGNGTPEVQPVLVRSEKQWKEKQFTSEEHIHYQAFGEIWIHYLAVLQSSPSNNQHILVQKPQLAFWFELHQPTCTQTCREYTISRLNCRKKWTFDDINFYFCLHIQRRMRIT